jgi:hypothetical protein
MAHSPGWRQRKRDGNISIAKVRVKSLVGRTFGQLEVTVFAGKDKHKRAKWCCKCKCLPTCHDCQGAGCSVKVLGTRLMCGKIFSCGCSRTCSETRRRAALKVPVKVRKARAQLAANKCRGTHHTPSYRLSIDDAAGLLGVDKERVIGMLREGLIRTCYRGGRIKVSAADVSEYIAMQSGAAKRCPMDESLAQSERLRAPEGKGSSDATQA